jgi:hypothetical protein
MSHTHTANVFALALGATITPSAAHGPRRLEALR